MGMMLNTKYMIYDPSYTIFGTVCRSRSVLTVVEMVVITRKKGTRVGYPDRLERELFMV